jgi:hypothetical protein
VVEDQCEQCGEDGTDNGTYCESCLITLSAEGWWENAEECMRAAAYDKAADDYDNCVEWTGEFESPTSATNARAVALLRAGRPADVLAFAEGTEDDEKDPDSPTLLGLALLDLGQPEAAHAAFSTACSRGAGHEVRVLTARVGVHVRGGYPRPAAPSGYWAARQQGYADASDWLQSELCRRLGPLALAEADLAHASTPAAIREDLPSPPEADPPDFLAWSSEKWAQVARDLEEIEDTYYRESHQ